MKSLLAELKKPLVGKRVDEVQIYKYLIENGKGDLIPKTVDVVTSLNKAVNNKDIVMVAEGLAGLMDLLTDIAVENEKKTETETEEKCDCPLCTGEIKLEEILPGAKRISLGELFEKILR